MTSEEYIKLQLKSLVINFPEIRVRYDNDELTGSHIIEILPNETYNFKDTFKIAEEDFVFDFIEKYPFENIVFLAEEDDFKISKVSFEIAGNSYNIIPTTLGVNDFSCNFYNEIPFLNSLSDFLPEFSNWNYLLPSIKIQEPKLINEWNWLDSVNCYSKIDAAVIIDTLPANNESDAVYENAGENDYALAA